MPIQITCDRNTAPPNTYKVRIVGDGFDLTLPAVPLAQLQGIAAKLNEPHPVQDQVQGQVQGQAPSSLPSFQQWQAKRQANPPGDTGTPPGES